MNADALLQELIEHLRVVLGTTLDAPIRIAPATAPAQVWNVDATVSRGLQLTFAFDPVGATELARVMSGQDEPDEEVIQRSLREMCSQIASATAAKLDPSDPDAEAIRVTVPALTDWTAPANSTVVSATCATLAATLIVALATSGDIPEPAQRTPAAADADHVDTVSPAERLDVLLDIDLPLVVRFGCTQLPLKTLSRLGPGSLIDLSRAPDDPVELLVSDRIVARGEVVVVSGSYGIRVLEIVGSRDAARIGVTA
jgi:flagellar motor switch protein FliN/FliY